MSDEYVRKATEYRNKGLVVEGYIHLTGNMQTPHSARTDIFVDEARFCLVTFTTVYPGMGEMPVLQQSDTSE